MALSTNLTAYYKFEGNSNDSVNSYNGTNTNISYSTSYGKILQGASFDGSSSKIAIPVTFNSSAFSYAVWVYCTNTSRTNDEKILDIRNSGSTNYALISINSGNFGAVVYDGTNYLSPTVAITANTWTHFVLTVSNGSLNIYKNGSLAYNNAYTFNGVNIGGAGNAMIGQEFNDGAPRYYSGYLDEIGIWTRALSSTEVTQLYNSGTGITYPFPASSNTGASFLLKMI